MKELPENPSGDGSAYKGWVPEGDPPPKEVATNEGPVDVDSALGVIDPRS